MQRLAELDLLDPTALDHWLWGAREHEVAVLCGLYSEAEPTIPETLLLPHRIECAVERLDDAAADAEAASQRELFERVLALAHQDPDTFRYLLVVAEVTRRAGVRSIEELALNPSARTRRLRKDVAERVTARIPPGRGWRRAARRVLTSTFPFRVGPAIQVIVPLLVRRVVERIRDPNNVGEIDAVAVIETWLYRQGASCLEALHWFFQCVADRCDSEQSAVARFADYVTRHEPPPGVMAAFLLRAFVEWVRGPIYTEFDWPPHPDEVTPSRLDGALLIMWAGRRGEATIHWDARRSTWPTARAVCGQTGEGVPVEALELPELLTRALRRAGLRTVKEVVEATPAVLYGLKGVGRAGVDAITQALRNWAAATSELSADAPGIEDLRHLALSRMSAEEIDEISLHEVSTLPRTVVRDLEAARFETVGEVLRWSTAEMRNSGVLSPGRQQRLLRGLLEFIRDEGRHIGHVAVHKPER